MCSGCILQEIHEVRNAACFAFPKTPMPAIELAQPENPHAGHMKTMLSGLPAEALFPYGFPKAGACLIFVQMKRAGEIAPGVFDAQREP